MLRMFIVAFLAFALGIMSAIWWQLDTGQERKARRAPPGYRFHFTNSNEVSPSTSHKRVIWLTADDGVLVLSGSVLSVGQYEAIEDYALQEKVGDSVAHANTDTMVDFAWTHYELRVNWWHRNVTQYATVWAVVVALFLGVFSPFITILLTQRWGSP